MGAKQWKPPHQGDSEAPVVAISQTKVDIHKLFSPPKEGAD